MIVPEKVYYIIILSLQNTKTIEWKVNLNKLLN